MTHALDISRAHTLHLAFGAEWRVEEFRIRGGETASWEQTFNWNGIPVDLQSQGFTAGTNGFPGFSPDTAGKWARSNAAVYGDVGWMSWKLDARHGGTVGKTRGFGDTVNGKLATAGVGGGRAFRAP